MPAGRPSAGLHHVDHLEGSPDSKRRLKAILSTLSGRKTIVEACLQLGIGSSRFHDMRHEALQAALLRLEPHAPGRKSALETLDAETIRDLRRRAEVLEVELVLARTRAEVAEVLPDRRRRRRGG